MMTFSFDKIHRLRNQCFLNWNNLSQFRLDDLAESHDVFTYDSSSTFLTKFRNFCPEVQLFKVFLVVIAPNFE